MLVLGLVLGSLALLLFVGIPLAPTIERAVLLRRARTRRADGTLDQELATTNQKIAELEDKWAGRAGRHGLTAGLGGAGSGTAISDELNRARAWREALVRASGA